MPLVRFEVRNEYSLGQAELYRGTAVNKEDPKQVLDGVAVSGLVGILRQLGDLAEFAAEVFHGLQEQVMTAASRSHKLMVRVHNIEAALPTLERAILAQNSHIHFAYTAGSEWHPRIKNEQNLFICNDLPRFILDSYEECRDPPRLHLLDKFDTDGPGSCLKRYSDPTFFRRASGGVVEGGADRVQKDKKARKAKKKRTSQRNSQIFRGAPLSNQSARVQPCRFQFTSPVVNGLASHNVATADMTVKSGLGDQSRLFSSRNGSGYIECVFDINSSSLPDPKEPSSRSMQHKRTLDSDFPNEHSGLLEDTFSLSSSQEQSARNSSCVTWEQAKFVEDNLSHNSSREETTRNSSCVTWDEKAEILKPKGHDYVPADESEMLSTNFELNTQDVPPLNPGIVEQKNISFGDVATPTSISNRNQLEEIESELEQGMAPVSPGIVEQKSISFCDTVSPTSISGRNQFEEIENEPENFESRARAMAPMDSNVVEQKNTSFGDTFSQPSISGRNQLEEIESEPENFVDALNSIESESETDIDSQTKRDLRQSTTAKSGGTEDGLLQCNMYSSDNRLSSVQSQTISGISLDNEVSTYLPDSVLLGYEPMPQVSYNETEKIEAGSQQLDTNSAENRPPFVQSETVSGISSDNGASSNLPDPVPSRSFTYKQTPLNASINDGRTDDEIQQPSVNNSVEHATDAESLKGSIISSDNIISSNVSQSLTSESLDHKQGPLTSEKSFDMDHLSNSDGCVRNDAADSSRVESVSSEPSFSGSRISIQQDPPGGRTMFGIFDSQVSHADSSTVPSISIWTNGGLLGLQPSKPSVLSSSNSRMICGGDETLGSPNPTFTVKRDMPEQKQRAPAENFQQTGKVLPGSTDTTNLVAPTTELPLNMYIKATSTDPSQENDVNLSGVFGLGHRLLRKVSLVHDGRSEPASSHVGKSEYNNTVKAGVPGQKSENQNTAHQDISEAVFKEIFGCGSPVSLTSSPPLEHMKISFNPIDGFETSKLKLKFPDGSHSHESFRDMFPSFQLVPEPDSLSHDIRSDSDDDTFCRSSPYMSDDCASYQSESDSDQWESGEAIVSNEHNLCDTVCIMPSESFSNPAQLGVSVNNGSRVNDELKYMYNGNGDEQLCSPVLDLPSFDAVNAGLQGDRGNDLDARNLSNSPNFGEPTPVPPPFPPTQWRVSKSQSDEADDKQFPQKGEPKPAVDQKSFRNSLPKLSNPYPAEQKQINEEIVRFKQEIKQSQQLMSNGLKESNQAHNGNSMDEKEDFLQQIRAKSFNLRPTAALRPAATPTPATNVNVTAILKKANAIRQVVASDDGEDEGWSDNS